MSFLAIYHHRTGKDMRAGAIERASNFRPGVLRRFLKLQGGISALPDSPGNKNRFTGRHCRLRDSIGFDSFGSQQSNARGALTDRKFRFSVFSRCIRQLRPEFAGFDARTVLRIEGGNVRIKRSASRFERLSAREQQGL